MNVIFDEVDESFLEMFVDLYYVKQVVCFNDKYNKMWRQCEY